MRAYLEPFVDDLDQVKDALKNARQPVFDVVDRKDHVCGGLNVRGHVKYELTMGTKRV